MRRALQPAQENSTSFVEMCEAYGSRLLLTYSPRTQRVRIHCPDSHRLVGVRGLFPETYHHFCFGQSPEGSLTFSATLGDAELNDKRTAHPQPQWPARVDMPVRLQLALSKSSFVPNTRQASPHYPRRMPSLQGNIAHGARIR